MIKQKLSSSSTKRVKTQSEVMERKPRIKGCVLRNFNAILNLPKLPGNFFFFFNIRSEGDQHLGDNFDAVLNKLEADILQITKKWIQNGLVVSRLPLQKDSW